MFNVGKDAIILLGCGCLFLPLVVIVGLVVWLVQRRPAQTAPPGSPSNHTAQTPASTPAGWLPDPSGRHGYRYWDGRVWTAQVSDSGAVSTDPLQP